MLLINKNDISNSIKLSSGKEPNFNAPNTKTTLLTQICVDFDMCNVYTNSKGTYLIVKIKDKWYRALICQLNRFDKNADYTTKQEAGYYKRRK